MGNHRADVAPSGRPSEQVTPYIGRRRALPAEAPTEAPRVAPYVGRRRAGAPASAPGRAPEPTSASASQDGPLPTATQLRDLLGRSFDETAPRPRITPDLVEMLRAVETASAVDRRTDTASAAADASTAATPTRDAAPVAPGRPGVDVPMPRRSPEPAPTHTHAALFAEDSRVDIPAVGLPADLATDHTVSMPLVPPSSGHRRVLATRPGRRRFLTLPIGVGVASLAVVVTGVVLTGHSGPTTATDPVAQAAGLGGYTGSDADGGRTQTLSRSSDVRNPVARAAANRMEALDENNRLANSYDNQLQKNLWVLPITPGDYVLTARFGEVSGLWATVHTGLDFACPTGTPIHAIANGTITFAGWDGAYGNKTVETLADGTQIWYAHQNEFGTHVGATVTQGQVIGYVGSTGNTTGPHVHIEVRPDGGDPIDPDPVFKEHGVDPDAHQQ